MQLSQALGNKCAMPTVAEVMAGRFVVSSALGLPVRSL